MEKNSKNIAVVYHYPCYDGAFSCVNLYLYYTHFNKKYYIYFYPSNSHNRISEVIEPENKLKYSKVFILDKGLNDEDFEHILKCAAEQIKFYIIDHHSSSIDIYDEKYKESYQNIKNIKIIFDNTNERAASSLTFDYFNNKATKKNEKLAKQIFDEKWKKINDYIEDTDIGNFKLKYTHEFKSGLAE